MCGGTVGVGGSVRFWPAYQFFDPRGILYAGGSEVSYANWSTPGSFLEVAYNPANPNQSFQVDAPSKGIIGCIIPAFGKPPVEALLEDHPHDVA